MGRPLKDLSGQRFGRLTVIGIDRSRPTKGGAHWLCSCDCGGKTSSRSGSLVSGSSTSCGCLARERTRQRSIKHGMEGKPIYQLWDGMIRRCYNPNHAAYKNYGGRGITVCDRWRSFEKFFEDIGFRPEGMSLDRIDNDKGYSPDNCRWATQKEQCRNTRTNRMLTAFGTTKSLIEWAEHIGVTENLLRTRLRSGWAIERALTEPSARPMRISANGKDLSISEWAKETGLSASCIRYRISKGWPPEKAVSA